MTTGINEFKDGYAFLSNFYAVVVAFDGEVYPSVEHAYQAAKTLDHGQRDLIRVSLTPGIAKRRGQGLTLRPDWEQVKLKIMYDLLRQKFGVHTLGSKLLETGNAVLIEGNHWNDELWGVDLLTGKGMNLLGNLLMIIRDEIRRERKGAPTHGLSRSGSSKKNG